MAKIPPIKILGQSPLKIPAGGTAKVELETPMSRAFGRLHLELSDPPEGITIKSVSPSRDGAEIVFESDAAKAKPGLKGNLIINIGIERGAPAGKAKNKLPERRGVIATLPAIPFEVVGP